MTGYTNYNGAYLADSGAFTRQIWASGTSPLYGPDTPSSLMGNGAGNYIQGGAANDTIYVISTADRISGGGGVDTAYATVNFTLPSDVENLTMDGRWSPVLGVGNDSANILTAVNAKVTIEGRGGADVIVSGGGDTFVFAPGSSRDTLINFHTDSDVVRLSGFGIGTFAQAKAAMIQVGADTLLNLSSTDSILFKGVQMSAFNAGDFQLSINPTALKPTFDDEFDTLNLQRQGQAKGWASAYAWDNYSSHSAHTISGESQVYVDASFAGSGGSALGINPFSVSNGVLSISAGPTPDWAKGALWGHDYTSGLLTTAGSFSQTYGYFEMRADLPEGKGSFPAFWLVDDTYNEIDVMETVNGSDQTWSHVHYHPAEGSSERASVGFATTVPNLTAGFHTFGVLWSPQALTWYVDGAAVATTATPATMNKPMYMIVDYAVGGSWAGAPDGSGLSDMHIDYVRAYSLENAPTSPGPTPGSGSGSTPVIPATPAPATPPATDAALSVAANSAMVAEGTGGTSYAVFTVTRSGNLTGPSTATWSTSGSGSSPADAADFPGGSLPSGQVFFGAGESSKAVWVPIAGDSISEANETFVFNLSGPTGATLGSAQASVVIQNDDGAYVPPTSAPAAGAELGSTGAHVFALSTGGVKTIPGFSAGHDVLSVPVGSGGFQLAGYTGQSSATMVDASAWWNNISGAQVVRWTGDPNAVDSVAEVDGLLKSMPGTSRNGVLVVGYTPEHKVGVYYDSNAASGGTSLVAVLDNQTDARLLDAGSFSFSGSPGTTTPPSSSTLTGAFQTGTAGNDIFMLAPGTTETMFAFDVAGTDALGVSTSAFGLAGLPGSSVTMTDASAWWNNISGSQVVRWTGQANAMDSAAEVDGILQSMPGTSSAHGIFMVGYNAAHKVGVYYDSDPAHAGGTSLVATLDNLTDANLMGVSDFHLFA